MDEKGRKESGASEVIGAVLLVALVVIGGAIVAAMVFGQPTPKEVPHVMFGVTKNNTANTLTLHHTGGDSLVWTEYSVIVDDVNMTDKVIAEDRVPWSSDGELTLWPVTQPAGKVVLTFKDNSAGDTALRIVPFEDTAPQGPLGHITGIKYNVSAIPPHRMFVPPQTLSGVTMTLYRWVSDSERQVVGSTTTGADGTYSLEVYEWGKYQVKETLGANWVNWGPHHNGDGWSDNVTISEASPNAVVPQFENYYKPPAVPAIGIVKVTLNGTSQEEVVTIVGGMPITWRYTVTNPGTVPLSHIQVIDDAGTPGDTHDDFLAAYVSGDTNKDGKLDTTETWIFNATGRAIVGSYCNIGTATGKPPSGSDVTASDENCYTGTPIITTTTISGTKYRVNETGVVQGTPPQVTITLELIDPKSIPGYTFPMTTTTAADGSYSFTVPDVPATYRLTESGFDIKQWIAYSPIGGVINGVVPGGTGYNFLNQQVSPNGIVMFLNKTVEAGCEGGHVVNGTTFMGDASKGNWVTFEINGKEDKYTFGTNEEFRFTIVGDQAVGELKVDKFQDTLTSLTFNVRFEVRQKGTTTWNRPPGMKGGNGPVIGKPTSIYIDSINRNYLNEQSTLTYLHPPCLPSQTLLRLNGQVWCDVADPPGENTTLDFRELHLVHDNRYSEGLKTMWIYLMPGYDYLLVQGECWSP